MSCDTLESGAIEQYFYGEMDGADEERIAGHVRGCRECAEAFRELKVIQEALAARPPIAAPEAGDWSGFMQRLDAAVLADRRASGVLAFGRRSTRAIPTRSWVGLLATAALLAVVAMSVFLVSQTGRSALDVTPAIPPPQDAGHAAGSGDPTPIPARDGVASVGLRHLERSKLVVLGLAAKEPSPGDSADWAYERDLATALLNDTRLYRMAAEERGLTSLAGVMKDLELVLLQASMAESSDATALPQIQRLIQKRGLVQKMDVVGTTGLLP